MGEKGFSVLETLIKNHGLDFEILFIESDTDKNVINDYFEDIRNLANFNKISFFKRNEKLNKSFECDLIFAVSWRWLINLDVKLIVFHDSLLPKYRGFNPLVTALINGDKQIGVTALVASEGYDEGNIIGVKSTVIEYPIKINEAIKIISRLYSELILDVLLQYSNDSILEKIQKNINVTYSLWRDEEDYHIDWTKNADEIKRFIDAVGYPYKGAYSYLDTEKIRILEVESIQDLNIENRTPGKLFSINNNVPLVVCGNGLLKLISCKYDNSNKNVFFTKLRTRLK